MCESVAGTQKEIISPATGECIAKLCVASKEDTELALQEAQKGFEYWSKLSLSERNEWIAKLRNAVIAHKDELHYAVMYEMGKTWESADEDIDMIVDALEYYPNEMLRMQFAGIARFAGVAYQYPCSRTKRCGLCHVGMELPDFECGI